MASARDEAIQAPSTAHIRATAVEPTRDIERERRQASFDPEELGRALIGRREMELRKRVAAAMAAHPTFSKRDRAFLERRDLYTSALRMQLGITNLAASLVQGDEDVMEIGKLIFELIDQPGPLDLHIGMFIPTLIGQGSDEQKAFWLPLAYSLRIIGTYAQTEVGHGTFLRGLETTATYDPAAEEFLLHSPTLSSSKFWPGGLGRTATHCILMARLFTQGIDRGPHAFVIALRDPGTHAPLAGVELGDIGPKLGYNALDNGYLRLSHVRVPRAALLSRHCAVDADGSYRPPPTAKASYATMVLIRSDIVANASAHLQRAVTIAVRYSLVRRQGGPGPDGRETQVMDYGHVQRSLLPCVAAAVALRFTGRAMRAQYSGHVAAASRGDFSMLPALHASSSALKALATWETAAGIEACRYSCGGHGFAALSGFPHILGNYMPQATYEGDNNVLCLQAARHLHKAVCAPAMAAHDSDTAYLHAASAVGRPPRFQDPTWLCDAYAARARRLVHASAALGTGDADEPQHQAERVRSARAHASFVVMRHFVTGVAQAAAGGAGEPALSPAAHRCLERLVVIRGLAGMADALGDWLEDGTLTGGDAAALRDTLRRELAAARPDAAAIVDSFHISDYELGNSCLGAYDGDVYRRLLEASRRAPFNDSAVPPGYGELLKPLLGRPAAKL